MNPEMINDFLTQIEAALWQCLPQSTEQQMNRIMDQITEVLVNE